MERIKKEKMWLIAIIFLFLALYFLSPILGPFIAAFIIAYLGNPLVTLLMKWGVPRTWAASLVFLLFLFIVVAALLLLIPILEQQLILFYNKIPVFLSWVQDDVVPWLNQQFGLSETLSSDYLKRAVAQHLQQTSTVALSIWKTVSHSGMVIVDWLLTCLLVPVVTFYLLRDWKTVWLGFESFVPSSVRPKVIHFLKESDDVLSAFLRGQLIVILCLGCIYSFGLWLAGLEFALLVGLFSGLINIVPYLGLIVGVSIASIMMFLQYHDAIHVLYAVLVYLIGSGIDNTVLTPNLIGDRIGLHPIAVIFAILAGGHLFGFVGVLLALPVASILMVLLRHLRFHLSHVSV